MKSQIKKEKIQNTFDISYKEKSFRCFWVSKIIENFSKVGLKLETTYDRHLNLFDFFSNNSLCFGIIDAPGKIRLTSLHKCDSLRGSTILRILIESFNSELFLSKTRFELGDTSRIEFKFDNEVIKVSLLRLFILTKGITWYESFGFKNNSRIKNQDMIIKYINSTNEDGKIIKNYVKNLQKKLISYKNLKEKVIEIKLIVSIIDSLYEKLIETIGEDLDIQHYMEKTLS